MDNAILKVNNLTCIFNEKQDNEVKVIDDFSYTFDKNKIYFIIGNSGSGKSTLVAHFNGLLKSKHGSIWIDGFEINPKNKKIRNAKKLRQKISMVFQFPEYQLFKTTIEKDISFGPIALGIPKEKSKEINKKNFLEIIQKNFLDDIKNYFEIKNEFENIIDFFVENKIKYFIKIFEKKDYGFLLLKKEKKVWKKKIEFETKTSDDYAHEISMKYLNKMGLNNDFLDKSPFELSGGQKRRVAIAGILAIEPSILVFDEPTAGLDPQGEHEMMQIILDAKSRGQTVIVITHTMDQVLETGDEVIVMEKGKILFSGEPYSIFSNKELYEKTNMEKPKIIEIIDGLIEKDKIFKKLYEIKPKNVNELSNAINSIIINRNKKGT